MIRRERLRLTVPWRRHGLRTRGVEGSTAPGESVANRRHLWMYVRSIPTSIRFNLAYLPLRQAIRLPVLVSHRVWLARLHGRIELPAGARTGTVRIGFGSIGLFDVQRSRTVWKVDGRVVFRGTAWIGHGSRILVEDQGVLTFGDVFRITAESTIYAVKSIRFGDEVLMSWQIQIMDSDGHPILDQEGSLINPDADVVVGNHVWIGSRATVTKGVRIADGTVVAAGAVVTGRFDEPGVILGGVPASVIRRGISWRIE